MSIMFLNIAYEIWKQHEMRFSRTDGNRKYQVNRVVYCNWQKGTPLDEYYSSVKALWKEIDSLIPLPLITGMDEEIQAYAKESNLNVAPTPYHGESMLETLGRRIERDSWCNKGRRRNF
ncbi:50S ribosomal protein L1 [Bienertia sinuspersici]